ncbi:hypothetical protein THAOC_05878 [Thalassiosira oceanica]|uniref:Uncharacterized protein n=1 Tax=Thalassiosira oceanica TaxID=159749 RepID=K0TMC0_THAOC|nr:hypothetical protein THAOC_05878 [Thalassiosira oceanica]|eukprot:EJK72577.1 hypothetical protein THAOC_05878 [Thalassiosira oceanica]
MAAHDGVPSGYDSVRAAEERRRGDGMRSSRGILDSIRAASGRDAPAGSGGRTRRSRSADHRAAFGSAFHVVSPSSLAAGRRRTKGRAGGDPPAGPPEMSDAEPHAPAYTTAGDPSGAEEEGADRPDREGAAVVSDDEGDDEGGDRDDDGSDADFDEIARPWKDGTWDGPPVGRQRSRRQGSDADTDSEWGRDTDSEWDVDGTDEGHGGGGTTGDVDVFWIIPITKHQGGGGGAARTAPEAVKAPPARLPGSSSPFSPPGHCGPSSMSSLEPLVVPGLETGMDLAWTWHGLSPTGSSFSALLSLVSVACLLRVCIPKLQGSAYLPTSSESDRQWRQLPNGKGGMK